MYTLYIFDQFKTHGYFSVVVLKISCGLENRTLTTTDYYIDLLFKSMFTGFIICLSLPVTIADCLSVEQFVTGRRIVYRM